jgi:hypothetical protein
MPQDDLFDENLDNKGWLAENDDNADADADEDSGDEDEDAPLSSHPETAYLPLPSHLGHDHFKNPLIAALAAEEVNLHMDQASDALNNFDYPWDSSQPFSEALCLWQRLSTQRQGHAMPSTQWMSVSGGMHNSIAMHIKHWYTLEHQLLSWQNFQS